MSRRLPGKVGRLRLVPAARRSRTGWGVDLFLGRLLRAPAPQKVQHAALMIEKRLGKRKVGPA